MLHYPEALEEVQRPELLDMLCRPMTAVVMPIAWRTRLTLHRCSTLQVQRLNRCLLGLHRPAHYPKVAFLPFLPLSFALVVNRLGEPGRVFLFPSTHWNGKFSCGWVRVYLLPMGLGPYKDNVGLTYPLICTCRVFCKQ
jgi:hypothetical protein